MWGKIEQRKVIVVEPHGSNKSGESSLSLSAAAVTCDRLSVCRV